MSSFSGLLSCPEDYTVLPPLASFVDHSRSRSMHPSLHLQETGCFRGVKEEKQAPGGGAKSSRGVVGDGERGWPDDKEPPLQVHHKDAAGACLESGQRSFFEGQSQVRPNTLPPLASQVNELCQPDPAMFSFLEPASAKEVDTRTEKPQATASTAEVVHATPRRHNGHRGGRQREKTPPFMSDEQRRRWEKERRKKDIHNKIEQRRRYNINDRIHDLGILLIKGGREIRQSKGSILREATAYIKHLRGDQLRLGRMEAAAEKLDLSNRELFMQIQRTEALLQAHGFNPVSTPLHHWTIEDSHQHYNPTESLSHFITSPFSNSLKEEPGTPVESTATKDYYQLHGHYLL